MSCDKTFIIKVNLPKRIRKYELCRYLVSLTCRFCSINSKHMFIVLHEANFNRNIYITFSEMYVDIKNYIYYDWSIKAVSTVLNSDSTSRKILRLDILEIKIFQIWLYPKVSRTQYLVDSVIFNQNIPRKMEKIKIEWRFEYILVLLLSPFVSDNELILLVNWNITVYEKKKLGLCCAHIWNESDLREVNV